MCKAGADLHCGLHKGISHGFGQRVRFAASRPDLVGRFALNLSHSQGSAQFPKVDVRSGRGALTVDTGQG